MKASTRTMIRKHGWRIDRALHHYLYFTRYHPYVRLSLAMTRLATAAPRWFRPSAMLFQAAFGRYHAKVLSSSEAVKILTLREDIRLAGPGNRQIIPYAHATGILFREPDFIAVMDCPCRAARGGGKDCAPVNCCIAVGRDVAGFWLDHCGRYNPRRITQEEALALIRDFRKRGHVTQAFFKVATGGTTGVICSCCPDCCVSLEASRRVRKFGGSLSQSACSGYSVRENRDLCRSCGACAGICPFGAMNLQHGVRSYDRAACMGCELCVEHCPEGALSLYRDPEKPLPLDMDWVRERMKTEGSVPDMDMGMHNVGEIDS
ncbi:MAG: 4Fe-4S binding protein [Syntrophaceae bacterium]|nr:4Fe-4S binding protein [Syntrophaceae bacterium]